MNHLAIIYAPYIDAILEGRKTVESRLSLTLRAPYGVVSPGDVIFLKERSGPVRGAATVERVECFEDLTPARVRELRRRFSHAILGPDAYWEEKRLSRYATFIWLTDMRADIAPPVMPALYGRGWAVLRDAEIGAGAARSTVHRVSRKARSPWGALEAR